MFNILSIFIPHTYIQSSLHFNSLFSPLALLPLYIYLPIVFHVIPPCQIFTNQKQCHLLLIFQCLALILLFHLSITHMSWLQPRKRVLHFILSDNDNYDFDINVGHCEFMDFVNDVIDRECLECVFYFRIKEKKKRHILNLFFYNILPKVFFFFFSLLQLNNYNRYVCAIYNFLFLWWTQY